MAILRRIKRALRSLLPHMVLMRARWRALLARRKLPPGKLVGWDVLERSDRLVLLRHAASFGPVFKSVAYDLFWICIVDLRTGRRFLRDNADHLQSVTLQLKPFVPGGFLRQMQGDLHRKYRRAIMHALVESDTRAHQPMLESIAGAGLIQYAQSPAADGSSSTAYMATLNAIATSMLVVIFFGVAPGSALHDQLVRGFGELGPDGLVWHIGDRERRAFDAIRTCLLDNRSVMSTPTATGAAAAIIDRALADGTLDDTLLGNLIYMVEMGRHDTLGLLRWLSKYAAERPDLVDRIASEPAEPDGDGVRGKSLAEAFVLETLRMQQSERLIRIAKSDIMFDGYFIPKDSRVRVCLWESHKSADSFPEPYHFQPERFQSQDFDNDQFAPFGLDHHQCPFGGVAMQTSIGFLRTLARGYTMTAMRDGEPVRGMYVWEPAAEFSVRLMPRRRE